MSGGGHAGEGQFSVHAETDDEGAEGHFNYHGHDLRIESDRITSVTAGDGACGPGTRGIVTGAGTVNETAHVTFEVTADDCGEPGNWHAGGADHLHVVAGGVTVDGDVDGNIQVGADD